MPPVLLLFLGSLVGITAPASISDDVDPLGSLSAEQRTALETAIDDRDHQESAFDALMSAMEAVSPGTLKSAALDPWNPARTAEVLGAPDAWRGRSFELTGRLEQSERLDRPWSPFVEWFLRLPDGSAAAVYLPIEEDRALGERVRVAARFYKRISAEARDGIMRSYPAFAGRIRPRTVAVSPDRLIIIGIVLLILSWVLLSLFTGRRGRIAQRKVTSTVASDTGEPTSLPKDPVDALDELARRHDDRLRKGDP